MSRTVFETLERNTMPKNECASANLSTDNQVGASNERKAQAAPRENCDALDFPPIKNYSDTNRNTTNNNQSTDQSQGTARDTTNR